MSSKDTQKSTKNTTNQSTEEWKVWLDDNWWPVFFLVMGGAIGAILGIMTHRFYLIINGVC